MPLGVHFAHLFMWAKFSGSILSGSVFLWDLLICCWRVIHRPQAIYAWVWFVAFSLRYIWNVPLLSLTMWPSERRIMSFLYVGNYSITCVSFVWRKIRLWGVVFGVSTLRELWGWTLDLVFKLCISSYYFLCAASASFLDRSVTFVLGFMWFVLSKVTSPPSESVSTMFACSCSICGFV